MRVCAPPPRPPASRSSAAPNRSSPQRPTRAAPVHVDLALANQRFGVRRTGGVAAITRGAPRRSETRCEIRRATRCRVEPRPTLRRSAVRPDSGTLARASVVSRAAETTAKRTTHRRTENRSRFRSAVSRRGGSPRSRIELGARGRTSRRSVRDTSASRRHSSKCSVSDGGWRRPAHAPKSTRADLCPGAGRPTAHAPSRSSTHARWLAVGTTACRQPATHGPR